LGHPVQSKTHCTVQSIFVETVHRSGKITVWQ